MPSLMVHGADHIVHKALQARITAEAPTALDDWQLFHSTEPGSPDKVITLYETQGQVDGRDMFGNIDEHQGISLRVRGLDAGSCRLAAATARDLLRRIRRATVVIEEQTYLLHCLVKFGQILYLGPDPKGKSNRIFYSLNFLASITPLP